MGESRSISIDVTLLPNEIQVNPSSNVPSDCCGTSQLSTGPIEPIEGGSYANNVEGSIENSKSHWSEVREFDCGDDVAEVINVELFETLQRHRIWGPFFKTFGDCKGSLGLLFMGDKFAEGGQAELYDVQVEWFYEVLREQDLREGYEWVLKVFKKGTTLRQLQAHWPQEMLKFMVDAQDVNQPSSTRFTSNVFGGTLLEDGRFAFLMVKEEIDLRSLIDLYRSGSISTLLLSSEVMMEAMYEIAFGMNQLHDRGIVHRDLKASNVLISRDYCFLVADYECSIGVVGTGFFRAPEILQACKDRTVSSREELFTKAADVYSYGMICYEILTSKLPFEGHPLNDYDLVINGWRPELPQYIDGWICELLNQCWHSNPASRPSFKEILKILTANSFQCSTRRLGIQIQELEMRIHEASGESWMILEKCRLLRLKLQIPLYQLIGLYYDCYYAIEHMVSPGRIRFP